MQLPPAIGRAIADPDEGARDFVQEPGKILARHRRRHIAPHRGHRARGQRRQIALGGAVGGHRHAATETQRTLDPEGRADTRLLLGGGLAWQAARASADFPFDVALTGEAGLSSGNNNTVVRIPFGASVGHTFTLDNGNQLTPFVHPRLSIDNCSSCAFGGKSDSKVNVDVDLGLNYEVTPQVALRFAAMLGGTSFVGGTNAIGFSVAWTPKGLWP